MKNQGVSLISLVITIIVVIILSAIAMGNGVLDLGERAQFTGFTMEMSNLRDNFKASCLDYETQLKMMNISVNAAQLYNYVARGLARTTSDSDEVYESLLTSTQAKTIPCTQIDQEYAEKYIGLDKRDVDTFTNRNQRLSYFITPKGNVFCWPPYGSEGKSYVNGDTTAKTLTGEEVDISDVTNSAINPTIKISFLNGEEIIIANSAPSSNNISSGSDVIDATLPSVWYSAETHTDANWVKKWGVCKGYTFEGYQRTE